jgi:hypothetical protein
VATGPSGHGEVRRTEAVAPPRPNPVSPFAADSARKGNPRQESAPDPISAASRIAAAPTKPAPVILGAAVPAFGETKTDIHLAPRPEPQTSEQISSTAATSVPAAVVAAPASGTPASIDGLAVAVLQALTDGNQRILVSMLEAGEWSVEGNELVIRVSESQTVVDMSLGPDARRLAIASASGVLGRAVKLKILPGAAVTSKPAKRNGTSANTAASGPGGRSRAEQDLVVQRLQEKFGAQIRTVIDYRDKR